MSDRPVCGPLAHRSGRAGSIFLFSAMSERPVCGPLAHRWGRAGRALPGVTSWGRVWTGRRRGRRRARRSRRPSSRAVRWWRCAARHPSRGRCACRRAAPGAGRRAGRGSGRSAGRPCRTGRRRRRAASGSAAAVVELPVVSASSSTSAASRPVISAAFDAVAVERVGGAGRIADDEEGRAHRRADRPAERHPESRRRLQRCRRGRSAMRSATCRANASSSFEDVARRGRRGTTTAADPDVDRAVADRRDPAVPGDRVAVGVGDPEPRLQPRVVRARARPVAPSRDAVRPVAVAGGAERSPEPAVRSVGDDDEAGADLPLAVEPWRHRAPRTKPRSTTRRRSPRGPSARRAGRAARDRGATRRARRDAGTATVKPGRSGMAR